MIVLLPLLVFGLFVFLLAYRLLGSENNKVQTIGFFIWIFGWIVWGVYMLAMIVLWFIG